MKKIISKIFSNQKYLFYFLIIWLIFAINPTFAQDVTSSDFTISVSDLDPIYWNTVSTTWMGGINSIKYILEKTWNILLMLIPLLAGVAFVIAGYFYIFSYTDGDNVTKWKNIIKYNIIAIIVAFMSGAIVRIVAAFL